MKKKGQNPGQTAKNKRVKLKSLNHLITCKLCKGYLIEAATVTECLHTFCKSCIVKYLETKNTCPDCGILIHHSHPLHYISLDRTLQDVVYKLVPNLLQREREREENATEKFHTAGGATAASSNAAACGAASTSSAGYQRVGNHSNGDSGVDDADSRHRPGITSEAANNYHRGGEQYIAMQVFEDASRFKEIDITCDNQLLGKDHSLKFVIITRSSRPQPLTLHYCMKLQF
uniref:RING-type domain-containing protein n=1 Tax=Macrostomum lignano TaxID=282301 RepID=A0A1I8G6A5_9PLAT